MQHTISPYFLIIYEVLFFKRRSDIKAPCFPVNFPDNHLRQPDGLTTDAPALVFRQDEQILQPVYSSAPAAQVEKPRALASGKDHVQLVALRRPGMQVLRRLLRLHGPAFPPLAAWSLTVALE